MIRSLALAAAVLALAAPGFAQKGAPKAPPTPQERADPSGAFSVKTPWVLEKGPGPVELKDYVAGTADEECWFQHLPREAAQPIKVQDVRRSYGKGIPNETWIEMAQGHRLFQQAPTVTSATMETIDGWPVSVAELAGKDGPVIAALHARPEWEVRAYCLSYDGKDRREAHKAIALSVKGPKDAEYAAEMAKYEAEKAAAEAAKAAAAETAAKEKPGRDKRN